MSISLSAEISSDGLITLEVFCERTTDADKDALAEDTAAEDIAAEEAAAEEAAAEEVAAESTVEGAAEVAAEGTAEGTAAVEGMAAAEGTAVLRECLITFFIELLPECAFVTLIFFFGGSRHSTSSMSLSLSDTHPFVISFPFFFLFEEFQLWYILIPILSTFQCRSQR